MPLEVRFITIHGIRGTKGIDTLLSFLFFSVFSEVVALLIRVTRSIIIIQEYDIAIHTYMLAAYI